LVKVIRDYFNLKAALVKDPGGFNKISFIIASFGDNSMSSCVTFAPKCY